MKNRKLLFSFIWYCLTHRDERFWQALRNWCDAAFILETNFAPTDFGKRDGWMKDTFYREGRTK